MNYFGLRVEHSSGNGDEGKNLRKAFMAVVSWIGYTLDEGGKIEGDANKYHTNILSLGEWNCFIISGGL